MILDHILLFVQANLLQFLEGSEEVLDDEVASHVSMALSANTGFTVPLNSSPFFRADLLVQGATANLRFAPSRHARVRIDERGIERFVVQVLLSLFDHQNKD
jgi:hypothetical protein